MKTYLAWAIIIAGVVFLVTRQHGYTETRNEKLKELIGYE